MIDVDISPNPIQIAIHRGGSSGGTTVYVNGEPVKTFDADSKTTVLVNGEPVKTFDADSKVNLKSEDTQVIERQNGDTPLYLRGNSSYDTYLGFRRKGGVDMGWIGVNRYAGPIFYSKSLGFDAALLISQNIKSSVVYNNYTRKIFKGSVGFLPDIGSDGSATFTFIGSEAHFPESTTGSKTVTSHRLTAWFCTQIGKTGADDDDNYYKLVILQMPASLLDLSSIGSRTFVIPKNNDVTLTITNISGPKSISYIANETWKNTSTGE